MSELAPKTEKKVIKTPSFVLKIYRKILPYLENLGVFAGAVIIDKIQFQYESAIRLDFLLIYIILIGIHYGLSQASVAVALSIGYLIFNLTGDGKNVISVLYDVNALIQINLYVFIGSVLGYGIDSKNYKIKETNNEKEKIEEKFDFLHTLYEESKIIRRELQDQIIGSEDSFRKIYDITSRLDSLKPEAIYDEAVGVIETVMKSTNVAIYMVSGDKYFLRLVAKSKKSDVEIIKSIRTETYKPAQEIFESRKMFVNSKLENGFPMLAMPITHGEDVVAIVAIFKMDFEFMSHYRQNLLITLASLITTALRKAYQYDHVIHEQKYMMDTMVLNASHFEDIHLLKQKAKDVNETDFVVLKIHEIDWYDKGDHLIAEKILREMDFLGVNEEGDLLILLPNTTNEEAGFVMKRFREKGIENIALVEEASDVEVDTDHTSTN